MTDRGAFCWRHWRTVDAVTIFHVDLVHQPHHEDEAEVWLDAAERVRRDRILVDDARRSFILCRATLRQLLCARLDCTNDMLSFGADAYGKPHAIIGDTVQRVAFNVSHSGAHGLVAIGATDPIGVDVEDRSLCRDIESIARLVFTATEQSALLALEGENRVRMFYRLWTMKEALMKGTGQGLSLEPASFALPEAALAGLPARLRLPTDATRSWAIVDLEVDAFAAALAFAPPS